MVRAKEGSTRAKVMHAPHVVGTYGNAVNVAEEPAQSWNALLREAEEELIVPWRYKVRLEHSMTQSATNRPKSYGSDPAGSA
jgi:hypothetical protein